MTNEKHRFCFQLLLKAGTETLKFYCSKIEEYPHGFIEKVYRVLDYLGVTLIKKEEIAAYQLRVVPQIWYNQLKEARPVGMGPIEWEKFKSDFLDMFFHLDIRENLVLEFINNRKCNMSVKEYELRFIQLYKYAPILVSDPRPGMSKFFVSNV